MAQPLLHSRTGATTYQVNLGVDLDAEGDGAKREEAGLSEDAQHPERESEPQKLHIVSP